MANIIEVRDLVKIYDKEVHAVNGINFDVREGEVFGFLGPNGAGKSTTISMITTLLRPTSGTITLAGLNVVKEATQVRKLIGLVPQDLTADDELSGRENMQLQADLYNVPRDIEKQRIEELLSTVKLVDAAERKVETYSGGMRKRLELVEGLIHRPKVLFLDEPTLGLDVQTREIIWEYIRKMKEESGMTIFLTTHYLEEADSLCDRIAIIDEGVIKVIGTPAELKASLGGDMIKVTVNGGEDYSSVMSSIPNVLDVKHDGSEYKLKTRDGDATMKDVLAKVAENGWKVSAISLHRPSMNQVFLEYTGKSLKDDLRSLSANKAAARQTALQNRRRR
ncbi:MAG: ATP-binding cassette domain-containing protein [Euryarchaeota archaeon]|nr:ATP-binding cassette domain-containing protein [Euryarchaeota archaeon]